MKRNAKNGVEKRSVSAPIDLFAAADERARSKKINNFSEYVRDLVRQDLAGQLPVIPAGKVKVAA
jgi:metal-responsive CopG/Arc/MetJ family transcriptional regulator